MQIYAEVTQKQRRDRNPTIVADSSCSFIAASLDGYQTGARLFSTSRWHCGVIQAFQSLPCLHPERPPPPHGGLHKKSETYQRDVRITLNVTVRLGWMLISLHVSYHIAVLSEAQHFHLCASLTFSLGQRMNCWSQMEWPLLLGQETNLKRMFSVLK